MPHSGQSPAAGRDEILAAATDLFAESGYDAISIQAIAAQAGTSKANVFHHFGAKEALYLEVMRDACNRFGAADRLADRGAEQRYAAGVVEFLRADFEQLRADPVRGHLILREVLESGPGRGRALAQDVFDEHFRLVVDLFRAGQVAGVFADDIVPEAAAVMMIAAGVFSFQSRHVLRHLPGVDFVDDGERYARIMGRILLDGMRARTATGTDRGEAP